MKCICNKKRPQSEMQSKLDPLPPQPGEQRGQKRTLKGMKNAVKNER